MKNKGKIVACLDIGTTCTVCIIAVIDKNNISILGYDYKESRGMSAGAISDMKIAQQTISNVVANAEKMAGFNVNKLIVSLCGHQVTSERRNISYKIDSEMVKNSDITNSAKRIRLEFKKNNREVIHLIPLRYKIDDSTPVNNPRYMTGNILATKFHIISTSNTTVKNIENCLKRCKLSVNNYIADAYASALACLTENELNLGTLVIDIGGGGSSYAIMYENKLIHTGNIPIGGLHITRDISAVLNIDLKTAEKIKNLNNSLVISPMEERELIKFRDSHDIVKVTKSELRDIISSRLEETLESVRNAVEKAGYSSYLINNVVVTGGVSTIIGIEKMAATIFRKQSRVGYPQKIKDLSIELSSPSFCSSLGMLAFLKEVYLRQKIKSNFKSKNSWFKRLIENLTSI